jgi:hypothetical protein
MPDKSIPDKASTKRGFSFRMLYVHESIFREIAPPSQAGWTGFYEPLSPLLIYDKKIWFCEI